MCVCVCVCVHAGAFVGRRGVADQPVPPLSLPEHSQRLSLSLSLSLSFSLFLSLSLSLYIYIERDERVEAVSLREHSQVVSPVAHAP